MLQFKRKARFTAQGSGGGFVVNPGDFNEHDLKIAFTITSGLSSTQNSSDIRIWNLSEGHRNALGKELDLMTLEAGYTPAPGQNNVGIIFKGNIRDVWHTRIGPDIVSILQCGDGDAPIRNAVLSKTYESGTPFSTVIDDMAKELEKYGVTRGEMKLPGNLQSAIADRPYTIVNSVKREMDTLSRGHGFYWGIVNNTLELIPADGFVGGVTLVSPETGMLEVPTKTDTGVKVACLLNPDIRVNRRISLKSQVLDMNDMSGEFRVSETVFSGTNKDGDFRVDITAERITNGVVDQGGKVEPAYYDPNYNVAQEYATQGLRGDK